MTANKRRVKMKVNKRRIKKSKNPLWDGDGVQGVGQRRDRRGRWSRTRVGTRLNLRSGFFDPGNDANFEPKQPELTQEEIDAIKNGPTLFEEFFPEEAKNTTPNEDVEDLADWEKELLGYPVKPLVVPPAPSHGTKKAAPKKMGAIKAAAKKPFEISPPIDPPKPDTLHWMEPADPDNPFINFEGGGWSKEEKDWLKANGYKDHTESLDYLGELLSPHPDSYSTEQIEENNPHSPATHDMIVSNKQRAVANIAKHLRGMNMKKMRKSFDLIPANDKGAEYSKWQKPPMVSDYQFRSMVEDALFEISIALSGKKAMKEMYDDGRLDKSTYYAYLTSNDDYIKRRTVGIRDSLDSVEVSALADIKAFLVPSNSTKGTKLVNEIQQNWEDVDPDDEEDVVMEKFVNTFIPGLLDESKYGTNLSIEDEKYPEMIAQAVVDGWARSSSGFLSGILQQRAREIFGISDAWQGNWVSVKGGEPTKPPKVPDISDFISEGNEKLPWNGSNPDYLKYMDATMDWKTATEELKEKSKEGHFGTPYWFSGYSDSDKVPEIYEAYPEMWDRIVTGMYEDTQAEFARRGITELFLHRGMDDKSFAEYSLDDDVEVRMQPLSSWSDDPDVTKNFGDYMFSSWVDVRDIWSSAFTGLGCTNEGEFVLLGGLFEASVLRRGVRWSESINKRRVKAHDRRRKPIDIDANGGGDWIKRAGFGDILISGNPGIFNNEGFSGHPRRIVKAKNPLWDGDGVQGVGQNRGKGGRWAKSPAATLVSAAQRAAEAREIASRGGASNRRQPVGTEGNFDHKKKSIADGMKIKKPQKGSTHAAAVGGKEIPRKTKYTPEEAYYHRNNGPKKISNDRLKEIFEDRSKATQDERDLVLSASSDANFDGHDVISVLSARFKGQERENSRYVLFKNLKTGLTQDYAKSQGGGERGSGGHVRINTGEKALAQNKKDSVKRANNQRNTVNQVVRKQMLSDFGDGKTAKCIFCGGPVSLSSISPERMKPGPIGGKYERGNIAPAHVSCNVAVGTDAQKKPDEYYDKMMKQFLKMYAAEIERGRLGTVFGKHRGKLKGKRPGRSK